MAKNSSKGKGGGKPIPKIKVDLEISSKLSEDLLKILEDRFENHINRHKGLEWAKIRSKLEAHPEKLASLSAMEITGGEPDVVGYDKKTDEYIFYDCSKESPEGRRSICYDGEAQMEREKKGVHPAGNAVDLASTMGIELLDESEYRELQKIEEFDTRTESWIKTPDDIRELGGALFCNFRYGHVFLFHNSAPSFYAGRGFRGKLRV